MESKDSDRHKERATKDTFKEVTFAYTNLHKTTELSLQVVNEKVSPLVSDVEKKFIAVLDYMIGDQDTQEQKFSKLWKTQGFSFGFNILGVESNLVSGSKQVYLYWGNSEHGMEYFSIPTHLHEKYTPESKDFIGFEELRQHGGFLDQKLEANIPNPSADINYFWHETQPVFWQHDHIIDELAGQHKGRKDFNGRYEEYLDEKRIVEEVAVEEMEKQALKIRRRTFQLVDSIRSIPRGKFILPKYIPLDNSNLRHEKHIDVFFLPRKKKLVRAPLLPSERIYKAKPDLKKATEIEPADWFRIARKIGQGFVNNLEGAGWKKPLLDDTLI